MATAVDWLEGHLREHGRTRSASIRWAAEQAGHSTAALNTARRQLALTVHRNDDRTTDWELPAPAELPTVAEEMERDQVSSTDIELDADEQEEIVTAEPIKAANDCPYCGQPTDRSLDELWDEWKVKQIEAEDEANRRARELFGRSPAAVVRAVGPPPCPTCGETMIYDDRGVTPPYFCRTHGRVM